MNERRRLSGMARVACCILAAVIPLGGCDGDTPTGPSRAVPPSALTPTPSAGPLAAVKVTLVPATSPHGLRHAFTVHIEARETRGVPVTVDYLGLDSSGGGYDFPNWSTGPHNLPLSPFGIGTFDVLVEHDSAISCSDGLDVRLRIHTTDGKTADIVEHFNCTTGYWPL